MVERRYPGKKFSQEKFDWNPQSVRQLSGTVLSALTHIGSLSDEEITAIRSARRFVHDAVIGLIPPPERVVSTDDVIAAYGIVKKLYPDEGNLKRLLGSSKNVISGLDRPNPGSLSQVELKRALEFFNGLYSGIEPQADN